MTIASEITRINNNIASAYTAVNNKGGTLPATQNSANLATAINSISGGGGGYTELPSYQVSNGVASKRSVALTGSEFSNITSVSSNGLYYAFYKCTGLTGSLDLSSLTSVSSNSFSYAFYGCTGLTSVNLSSLTSISSSSAFSYAFRDCTNLTSVNLSSLTSISGSSAFFNAFYGCTGLTSVNLSSVSIVNANSVFESVFYGCTNLVNVNFTSLTDISNGYIFNNAFASCRKLANVYFNSLTTTSFGTLKNQFSYMLSSTGNKTTHTLHFPSNLQSTISGLSGYPNFGGTSGYVTLSFDLPATS